MTKRYWPYFQNILHYPEIQRPGPLALLAQAEAGELDDLYRAGLKVRDQFYPSLAEKEALVRHGQARGVTRHRLESDDQFRRRVSQAFAWQRLAGRHYGLYQIFEAYGLPLRNLINLTGDHWAEFDLEVESPPGTALTEDVFELIFWIALEYKRAIALPRSARLLKRSAGKICLKAALAVAETLTVYPPPPEITPPEVGVAAKAATLTHERWKVFPHRKLKTFARPLSVNFNFTLE